MRTGWDIDGVGHTFSGGIYDHMHCEDVQDLWKSGPNTETYWDWYKDWGWTGKQFVEFCNRAADHGCLFTGHLRPGYAEGINEVAAAGHEIIIVTDRVFGASPQVSQRLTTDWLLVNGIWYDELIFSADKTVGHCDTFIEDKIENYDALRRAGTNAFLINRAWNKQDDNRQRIDEISEYVDEIYAITQNVYAVT